MTGVIIGHPIFMREYKLNEKGEKEYLSDKLKYGLFVDFKEINKTLCE